MYIYLFCTRLESSTRGFVNFTIFNFQFAICHACNLDSDSVLYFCCVDLATGGLDRGKAGYSVATASEIWDPRVGW